MGQKLLNYFAICDPVLIHPSLRSSRRKCFKDYFWWDV